MIATRNKLTTLLAVLSLGVFISLGIGIFAQVSNPALYEGVSAESTKLKAKPSDLGSQNTVPRPEPSKARSEAATAAENLPDYVAYGHLFRHIGELNKKARSEELAGRDGDQFRKLYQRVVGLTNQEFEALERAAINTNKTLSEIDIRAKILIAEFRSQVPNGVIHEGQQLSAPPAEIEALYNQRKQVIENAIAELSNNLGAQRQADFQRFVDQQIKPGIKPIN